MSLRVFVSSASGNLHVKKNQSTLSAILAARKIDFEQVDLTDPKNAECKQALIDELTAKSLSFVPPLIYQGEEYLGNYEDFFESLEMECVDSFLRVPGAKPKAFDELIAQTEAGTEESALGVGRNQQGKKTEREKKESGEVSDGEEDRTSTGESESKEGERGGEGKQAGEDDVRSGGKSEDSSTSGSGEANSEHVSLTKGGEMGEQLEKSESSVEDESSEENEVSEKGARDNAKSSDVKTVAESSEGESEKSDGSEAETDEGSLSEAVESKTKRKASSSTETESQSESASEGEVKEKEGRKVATESTPTGQIKKEDERLRGTSSEETTGSSSEEETSSSEEESD